MSKKTKIILLIIVGLLIVGYFIFKLIWVTYVNERAIPWLKNLTNYTEPITINFTASDKDYITLENMRIANYFSEFEKMPDFLQGYLKKSTDNSDSAFFQMTVSPTLVAGIQGKDSLFYNDTGEKNFITIVNWQRFFKKHDIVDDLDLMEFAAKNCNKNLSVFTPITKIKEINAVKQYVPGSNSQVDSVTLINGDYSGFTLNNSTAKEIRIIKDETAYILYFQGLNYFTDDLIKEIVSTLIID